MSSIKCKASQLLEAVAPSSSAITTNDAPVTPKLAELLDSYAKSDIATAIREEGEAFGAGQPAREPGQELPDVAAKTTLLRGHKRAGWGTQFRILSGRAFKNLYRDPVLLTAHYVASIALAGEYPLSLCRNAVADSLQSSAVCFSGT
jgi:hypothetical protein